MTLKDLHNQVLERATAALTSDMEDATAAAVTAYLQVSNKHRGLGYLLNIETAAVREIVDTLSGSETSIDYLLRKIGAAAIERWSDTAHQQAITNFIDQVTALGNKLDALQDEIDELRS